MGGSTLSFLRYVQNSRRAFRSHTSAEATFTTAALTEVIMSSSNRNAASRWPSGRASRAPTVEGRTIPRADPEVLPSASGSQERPDTAVQSPNGPVEPAPVVNSPKPPPRTDKLELTIDSLQNYELLKPIRVIVESLGDKVFVAEAPDLNVSTSGNSVGGTLILLKDHVSTIYEGYTSKKNLDGERARQFKVFETYIGRPKRNWM